MATVGRRVGGAPLSAVGRRPLTTVRQPLSEMASTATQMLLALINGEELETTRVELATPLVVRASTRVLRR